MTWLTPLFLAAGLAVAGPILFHLWQRTPRGRRLFSSAMFLTASPPRITRRSRIENWPLLLLRALALVLIAIAFARPVWRAESQAPTVNSPGKTIAILVDVSASMQRAGYWQSIAEQISSRLDGLPSSTPVGLFLFDHRWRPVISFDDADKLGSPARRQLVKEQLASIKPGWGSGRLGMALAQTMQAVREFEARRPVKEACEVWLASDLAAGSDLAGLAGIDWPESTTLLLTTPNLPAGTNAGLQWVESRLEDKEGQLRVRVSNAQISTRDRFVIAWETDASNGEPAEIHVPPGQSRTILAPPRPNGIAETIPLKLSGDDHNFDNRLWSATGRRRQVWVLYLGEEADDDTASPRFFLEQAFAGTPSADVSVRGVSAGEREDALVDPPVLAVWTDAAVEPPPWFRDALQRGGSLLAVPRTSDDARQMAAYLGLTADSVQEAEVQEFALLNDIDFEDPLFAMFLQARFADFTGIHFWKYRRLKLPASFTGRVLAKFDSGDPFAVYQTQGDGRSWMLTSGWHPMDSQLARSSKFAPLLQRMLEQSTPLTGGSSRGPIGSSISWPLSRSEGPLSIRRPDGTTDELADPTSTYTNTDRPGIYVASRGDETASWTIHVAPEESKTDPLPRESLERLGLQTKRPAAGRELVASPARQRQLQLEELERRQANWRWCLIAAGLVLLAETGWAARQSKMTAISQEAAREPA